MGTSDPDFFLSALEYFQQGYMAIPLELDTFGRPKKPIPVGWSNFPHSLELMQGLPWERARGLGVLMGPASGNLSAIDVDDEELASIVAPKCAKTRVVKTIRNRCHVYVREKQASKSRTLHVSWRDRPVTIELKCFGSQVAAPPTPGYELLSDVEPRTTASIGLLWEAIAKMIGIAPGIEENFPKPWQRIVPASQRNKSVYVESHRLREAGMPLEDALRIMEIRWTQDYEKGEQDWGEVARTIESAYGKGYHPAVHEVYDDARPF